MIVDDELLHKVGIEGVHNNFCASHLELEPRDIDVVTT